MLICKIPKRKNIMNADITTERFIKSLAKPDYAEAID
jgi:hypothetical protein